MQYKPKRDEDKLNLFAIKKLKKESEDFALLYPKYKNMLEAYKNSPEALKLREYEKTSEQRERDLKRITEWTDNDCRQVYSFAYGDGTITEVTGY